jgi:hypothetical protein
MGGLLAESLHNLPDHAKDCGPQGKRLPRRISPQPARPCDGLRIAPELKSSPDFSRAGDTMRWIADYGRLAWRISPRLARTCDGLRIARELTSSTDFSTAGDTMRSIADYGRLARRISPQLGRPCDRLRAVGEASASPDFSTVGETARLIAEGTLGGIMAINGSSVPTVSASAGWAVSTVAKIAYDIASALSRPELAEQTTQRGSPMASLRR